MAGKNGNDEFSFEILEHLGVLSAKNGWQKELNIVAWNGKPGKFDVRDWDQAHEHMSRGITLHKDEMRELARLCEENKLSAE